MAPPLFAHLHSSPLVVRRRGADWRSLRPSPAAANVPNCAPAGGGAQLGALEPVEIIDVQEERALLRRCLRESRKRIAWHSEVADLHAFRKVLSYGCRALHFSGHGVPGRVIFEDRKCEAHFVSQQELRDLLLAGGAERSHHHHGGQNASSSSSSGTSSSEDDVESREVERGWVALTARHEPRVPVKLVVVSACHSESVAEAFVGVGVPHVVVVSKEDKMLDKKAVEFAKAFYTALFAGHSVGRAFQIGHVQADIAIVSDSRGNSTFKLLGDGDHSEALFRDGVEDGEFIDNSLPLPANECDAVAEVFVGRSIEVHRAYKALVEGARLVSITGEPGIGKTEIALQCATYATERRVFGHIFFLKLDSDHRVQTDPAALLAKFARALGLSKGIESPKQLGDEMRLKCNDKSPLLLIVDGCTRAIRQNHMFRAIVNLLLRRVTVLSLMLTGDGKLGAMDGVGEKIVNVDRLPPSDAALLFTLRAPRKIRAHEMGGSPDLAAFGEHPIIKALRGHPRSICAVSQFLENKDMELDQHEFLNYIIPTVLTGLLGGCSKFDELVVCPAESLGDMHHHHHHHHHAHSGPIDTSATLDPSAFRHLRAAISQPNVLTTSAQSPPDFSALSLTGGDVDSSSGEVSTSSTTTSTRKHQLNSSLSESNLVGTFPASVSQQQEMCILKLVDHLKATGMNKEGCMVWAHAVVTNTQVEGGMYTVGVVNQLLQIRKMPLDWVAPQISRFFAAQLKGDAVARPLSLRSIDFLGKSSLIWGCGQAPSQLGSVDVGMFAAFWRWFHPLVECIAYSGLWAFTQPRLLHGFLSKGVCVNMLKHAPPGTFLLRFSETRPKCFVIAYVHDDGCVQFVPVTCLGSTRGWHVALQDQRDANGGGVTFSTIQELILSVTVLKYLFPQTPKEAAFRLPSP